jgi:ATP-dependent DNA helicase DinG
VLARGHSKAVAAPISRLQAGEVLIHNHPSGALEPSDADIAVAIQAGEMGNGSYIVDNDVTAAYAIAEPVEDGAGVDIDPDEIAAVLDSGGKLSRAIPGFEPRASQVELARDIARAFNDGFVLAAEAGTGVGKSYAYLLPAFAWAVMNTGRIAVATATINLQTQLMEKDIPVVASLFRKQVKAALVKGRANYLCLARLAEAIEEEGLFGGKDSELGKVAEWAKATDTGDRADMSDWPDDATWSRVRSEGDACLGIACPHRPTCFVYRMKQRAAEANVIVANHHILFADLATRLDGRSDDVAAVLPPVRAIIFDEAHAIESSATSFFSEEVDRFTVYKQLSRLYRAKGNKRFGAAVALQNLKKVGDPVFAALPEKIESVKAAIEEADAKALSLFSLSGNARESGIRIAARSSEIDDYILSPLKKLEAALLSLADALRDALEQLPDEALKESAALEVKMILRNVLSQASVCGSFGRFDDERGSVFWVEKARTSKRESFARFYKTPLDVGELMDRTVYSRYRSVVCVSATLAVGDSFEHWKKRSGLSRTDAVVETRRYPSPFPYADNALLALVEDAPMPDSMDYGRFVDRAVTRLIEAAGGSSLALFTSYEAMRSAYEYAKPRLDALGITCFRQGDGDRARLLTAFKADVSSVLFATDSFWEGVDAPGETLRCVIITKLPFRVPTDPVQKARADAIEAKGGNPFYELSLPEAALRFKQGFGRLIRHTEDYGVVVVLDPRIGKKPYGRLFVESLPATKRVYRPLELASDAVKRFLQLKASEAHEAPPGE